MTTLEKTVKRLSKNPFQHTKRSIVVELLDGDIIRLRPDPALARSSLMLLLETRAAALPTPLKIGRPS